MFHTDHADCLICRIVEYQTRDQAQNAVNTLSNQNLMGRLVYVREVCCNCRIDTIGTQSNQSSGSRSGTPIYWTTRGCSFWWTRKLFWWPVRRRLWRLSRRLWWWWWSYGRWRRWRFWRWWQTDICLKRMYHSCRNGQCQDLSRITFVNF